MADEYDSLIVDDYESDDEDYDYYDDYLFCGCCACCGCSCRCDDCNELMYNCDCEDN